MFKRLLFSLLALTALTAWADLPFRNHRYDGFKVIDTDSTQIVFIGNSITNMHEWWEAFADHRVINRGVSGAVSDETIANLEGILAGRPAKAFLMIGTNDLGTSGINTAAHVATNVRHILQRFKRESPRTELFVQSILPSRLRNVSLLRETNDSLRHICSEMGATYVDLWDKFTDLTETGNNTHTLDGLHLTASGYAIWCQAIAPLVGLSTVYSDATTDNPGTLGGAYGMRATYFAALPVREGDVLIIGDETVHGGEWHELLHSPRVKNRGNGWGLNSSEIAIVAKELPLILGGCSETGYPEQIFFYNGANEVSNTATAIADIMTAYRANVATALSYAPTAAIRLLPVIPGGASAEILSRAKTFNDSLRAYAEATEGVEFVDCYDSFYPGGTIDTRYFQGRYFSGLGYAKLSQAIAPYIEGATATTDSAANAALARFNARTTLASTDSKMTYTGIGDKVGWYTAEAAADLLAAKSDAAALLARPDVTNDELTAVATAIDAAWTALLPRLNQPTLSTSGDEHWYRLSTPLRADRYLTSTGAGNGLVGNEAHSLPTGMWKFVSRSDGSLDMVNRDDGSYISPASSYNTTIKTSATSPATGWTLSYGQTPGLFIVSSGTVELNQTQAAQNYAIYNWSSGQSGTDRNDAGCQFLITEAPEPEVVTPIADPVLTLTDITLDGTAPYRVADEWAAPVLSSASGTVAIDFTLTSPTADCGILVGSSNEAGTDYFSVVQRQTNRYGVQYIGAQNGQEGWYTKTATMSGRIRLVITMDAEAKAYVYYYNGTSAGTISGMDEAYGYRSFGNVPDVSGLFLGGVVTSTSANLHPHSGTIHSVRFWDTVLTAAEVGRLTYDGLVATAIAAAPLAPSIEGDAPVLYDLYGRPAGANTRGIVIGNGLKKLVTKTTRP